MTENKPPKEQWRVIPGYEGLYEMSDQKRVRSIPRQSEYGRHFEVRLLNRVKRKIMVVTTDRCNHPTVQLRKNAQGKHRKVDELFALTWPELIKEEEKHEEQEHGVSEGG